MFLGYGEFSINADQSSVISDRVTVFVECDMMVGAKAEEITN